MKKLSFHDRQKTVIELVEMPVFEIR